MNTLKESCLDDQYEFSQKEVAEKMLLGVNTVIRAEKSAIEKFKQAMQDMGITAKDILE